MSRMSGINSILISTLLTLLCQTIALDSHAPNYISELILESSLCIKIFTSSLPMSCISKPPTCQSDKNMWAWINMVRSSNVSPQYQFIISEQNLLCLQQLWVLIQIWIYQVDGLLSKLPLSQTTTSIITYLLCQEFEILEFHLKSAKYNGSKRMSLVKVTSHWSMVQILSTLGLLEKNMFLDTKSVMLQSGQMFSSTNIVKIFG